MGNNNYSDLKGISFLVVEADSSSLNVMEERLNGLGAQVYTAKDYRDTADILANQHINVIVTHLNLVNGKYINMIYDYKSLYPDSLFYLLVEADQDSVEATESLAKTVIDDYIKKPIDFDRFAKMVNLKTGKLQEAKNTSLAVVSPFIKKIKPYFIFRSSIMQRVLSFLPEISLSDQPVLITGETGTGKEIVARAIHVLSNRTNGPFVPLNCGAIPESLVEGELFGHEKGSFTGAIKMRKGRFESADKGTIFLDEIGDMSLSLQVRLLRVLEEEKVYRVGSETPIPINVRVVAATRVNLENSVEDKLFREDLYYRINVLRINLPPLRERKEDIPLLALHFLERAFHEMGRVPPFPELSPETIYILEQYPWKGNVRELRNVMTRVATVLPPGIKRLFPFHILSHLNDEQQIINQPPSKNSVPGVYIPLGTKLEQVEHILIKETLKKTNGNKTKAASMLGISLRTLRRKLNNPLT